MAILRVHSDVRSRKDVEALVEGIIDLQNNPYTLVNVLQAINYNLLNSPYEITVEEVRQMIVMHIQKLQKRNKVVVNGDIVIPVLERRMVQQQPQEQSFLAAYVRI